MRQAFADSFFWIALANPRDDFHQQAKRFREEFRQGHLITTDEALVEFLAALSDQGRRMRRRGVEIVRTLRNTQNVTVLPQSRTTFDDGLNLYEGRPDKGYSLTDCISMQTMERYGLREVLTNDHHFEQAGYIALFRARRT